MTEDGEYLITEVGHGASARDPHQDEIELESWSTAGGDDAGGDVDAPYVIGSLPNDADGLQYDETHLDFVQQRGEVDGVVGEVNVTGEADDGSSDSLTEDVSLEFAETQTQYEPQVDDGTADGSSDGGYDVDGHDI